MDVSLDDYIRENKSIPKANMSLDEYIHMNGIKSATHNSQLNGNQHGQTDSGPSKFDRYKHQDEDDDDEMDEDGSVKGMPKLVPFVMKTMPPKKKKPIHQRLGKRDSICESIHTSQMQLFRPNKFKAKKSVQQRLGKGYVNPAVIESKRIALHALRTFAKSEGNMLGSGDDDAGHSLLNAFLETIANNNNSTSTSTNTAEQKQKYDMKIQKEISYLQGKELYYACPGAFVISNDGPGLHGTVKVPSHKTDISLNQRFA